MEYIVKNHHVRYVTEQGQMLAEVTFPEVEPGVVDINHTFVDDSLRGQGVADELLRRAVDAIAHNGERTRASCSYATHWFEKHPEHQDLLA